MKPQVIGAAFRIRRGIVPGKGTIAGKTAACRVFAGPPAAVAGAPGE
jgi:hypothetical protein